jgi:hypothetical protein
LIECNVPWASEAFETAAIPERLRRLVESNRKFAEFLLISNEGTKRKDVRSLYLYVRSDNSGLSGRFDLHKLECVSYEEVCDVLESYFLCKKLPVDRSLEDVQNILICTHGAFDQCCGKYGKPFYTKSKLILESLPTTGQVDLWQSSHFGGHRFAPTMLNFPDGRYYGKLSEDALVSIINRTGDIKKIMPSYRGWAILPKIAQIVEKQLFLNIGWQWLDVSVSSQVSLRGRCGDMSCQSIKELL